MTNFDLKKINLQKLTNDALFKEATNIKETSEKDIKRFESLTIGEKKEIEKKYEVSSWEYISDADFTKEFNRLRPPIKRRKRPRAIETLKAGVDAMEQWLDEGKKKTLACDLAGIDRKDFTRLIPNILQFIDDPEQRERYERRLKALGIKPFS